MYLLDTNVVSELRKAPQGRADARVARWTSETAAEAMFISVITVMEIEIGIHRLGRRDEAQARTIRSWLETQVLVAFRPRIIDVGVAIAQAAAALHSPDPQQTNDALIAATASVRGFTIVTRNVADFAGRDIRVFNPWA